jgi:hypothetical protein
LPELQAAVGSGGARRAFHLEQVEEVLPVEDQARGLRRLVLLSPEPQRDAAGRAAARARRIRQAEAGQAMLHDAVAEQLRHRCAPGDAGTGRERDGAGVVLRAVGITARVAIVAGEHRGRDGRGAGIPHGGAVPAPAWDLGGVQRAGEAEHHRKDEVYGHVALLLFDTRVS